EGTQCTARMLVGSGPTDTGTETMNNWKRQRFAKAHPTSKEELRKIVEAYQGPITKLPMMTVEEMAKEGTENDKMCAWVKIESHTPSVVEVPVRVKPTITRRV